MTPFVESYVFQQESPLRVAVSHFKGEELVKKYVILSGQCTCKGAVCGKKCKHLHMWAKQYALDTIAKFELKLVAEQLFPVGIVVPVLDEGPDSLSSITVGRTGKMKGLVVKIVKVRAKKFVIYIKQKGV